MDRDESVSPAHVSVGLVFQLQWDAQISLDGDGGFSVRQLGQHFIFKPVSVKALWTVIQTLHMIVAERLRPRVGGAASEAQAASASAAVASGKAGIQDKNGSTATVLGQLQLT